MQSRMSSKGDQAGDNAASTADKPSNLPTSSEPAAPEKTEAAGTAHQKQEAREAGKASPTKSSATPAKSDDDEQQTDRPSARRERKQTAFFQPEAKAEAAKLDIKEASSLHTPLHWL